MRHQVRNVVLGGVAALLVVLGGGGAWACIPQARLVSIEPRSSGASGTQVTVKAVAFDTGPAEVRWNASDGPRLATAVGPDFSVPVTIPAADEGLHTIVVLSRSPNGTLGNAGTAAFQVTRPGGSDPTVPAVPSAATLTAESSSSGPSWLLFGVVLAVAAGALVALGVLLGATWSRRRAS